jgi:hypothetical protein
MKQFQRITFFLLVVLCACPRVSVAQAREAAHSHNYQNCLRGLYGCDRTQLTAAQQQDVLRAAHTRSYQNCLYGLYGCDQTQLTAEERQDVVRAAHTRNYQNCLLGLYGCNQSPLSTGSNSGNEKRTVRESGL